MAQGITFTTTATGKPRVTIDLERWGTSLLSFFETAGVSERAEKIIYKPNKKTIAAIKDARSRKNLTKFDSVDDFMEWVRNV